MITRNRILFAVGLLTVLLPFLGFPSSFEMFFTIAAGLIVSVFAFMYARDKRMQDGPVYSSHNHSSHTHSHAEGHSTGSFAERRPDVQTPVSATRPTQSHQFQPSEDRYTDLKSIISRSKNF
jgi:hypothetical protein